MKNVSDLMSENIAHKESPPCNNKLPVTYIQCKPLLCPLCNPLYNTLLDIQITCNILVNAMCCVLHYL